MMKGAVSHGEIIQYTLIYFVFILMFFILPVHVALTPLTRTFLDPSLSYGLGLVLARTRDVRGREGTALDDDNDDDAMDDDAMA